MNLRCLTDEGVSLLRGHARAHTDVYRGGVPSPAPALLAPGRHVRGTGIAPAAPLPVLSPAKDADADNAILLHTALRTLTPVQASEERIWACLTHHDYWDYATARWSPGNIDTVFSRMFVQGAGITALAQNALSRLWWGAHLTRDESLKDPYELTRVLFLAQDINTGLMERNFGKSAAVRRAVLRFFCQNAAVFDEIGWSASTQFLMRSLNGIGGVCLLDTLSEQDVTALLDASLSSLSTNTDRRD